MHLNNLNRDMFKPFRSLIAVCSAEFFGCVLEDLHWFYRGFLQRDASMRALWSDRPNIAKKFLGTKIYLPGSKQLKWTIPRNVSWNPIFLHGIKRRFPQCSQEHSQESKPQVPGTCVQPARGRGGGGGWKLPGGPLDNQGDSLDD